MDKKLRNKRILVAVISAAAGGAILILFACNIIIEGGNLYYSSQQKSFNIDNPLEYYGYNLYQEFKRPIMRTIQEEALRWMPRKTDEEKKEIGAEIIDKSKSEVKTNPSAGIKFSDSVDVTWTKADGTVMRPVNGEWVSVN